MKTKNLSNLVSLVQQINSNEHVSKTEPIGQPKVAVEKEKFMYPFKNKDNEITSIGWLIKQPMGSAKKMNSNRWMLYITPSYIDEPEQVNEILKERYDSGYNIVELRQNSPIVNDSYLEYLNGLDVETSNNIIDNIGKRQVVKNPKTGYLSLDEDNNPIYRDTGLIKSDDLVIFTKTHTVIVPSIKRKYTATLKHYKEINNNNPKNK